MGRKQNGPDFRLIELKIEDMEEVIENLNSTVEEHDGVIGKGYLFSVNMIFLANNLPKRQKCDRNFDFIIHSIEISSHTGFPADCHTKVLWCGNKLWAYIFRKWNCQ